MCGIIGLNWDDKILLNRMMTAIEHRGPDDSAAYFDTGVSLGMRRLKIIDLNKGLYPITNEKGNLHLIFNGEIFNYKKLREQLRAKGHKFATDCDAEVIVHLYEEKGPECLKDLNGFFAIAIWDNSNKSLFLARDRLGIKPLYYYKNGEKFSFASEMKAFLEMDDYTPSVDLNGFKQLMRFRYTAGEQTLLSKIKKVNPGHYLIVHEKMIIQKKYWNLEEKIGNKPESYYSKKLLGILRDSVEKRMMSDVPLGAYLSGGLDSTTIVGLMSRISNDPIKTFSVGFGQNEDNEFKYARMVSDTYNTEHYEVMVEEKELKKLPKMVWHMDEPIGDPATLPTFVISEFAKPKATVVLAGEGSDEMFAGYQRYKISLMGNKLSKNLPGFVTRGIIPAIAKRFSQNSNVRRASDIVAKKNLEERFEHVIGLFSSDELNKVVPEYKPVNFNLFSDKIKQPLNKMLHHDITVLLPEDFFMKVDKMTMANSLEERVPFLDHRLVEFSMSIPPQYKLRKGNEKYILKKAVRAFVPQTIIKRKKRGYNAPMNSWIKGPLYELTQSLVDSSEHGLYNKEYVQNMLPKFKKSNKNYNTNWYNAQKIWTVLMFEMWHKQFVQKEKVEI